MTPSTSANPQDTAPHFHGYFDKEGCTRYHPQNHLARPGPLYWDGRCRRCDMPVDWHPSWWQLVWRKLTGANPQEERAQS